MELMTEMHCNFLAAYNNIVKIIIMWNMRKPKTAKKGMTA